MLDWPFPGLGTRRYGKPRREAGREHIKGHGFIQPRWHQTTTRYIEAVAAQNGPQSEPERTPFALYVDTGSEIENVFIEALYSAFDDDKEPTDLTIAQVLTEFVPLSKLMAEQIAGLRNWAKGRARMATSVHG